MDRNSIKWRIQRWHGLLLLVLVTIMTIGFFLYERSRLREKLTAELSYTVGALIPRLIPPGGGRRGGEKAAPRRDHDRLGRANIADFLFDPKVYYAAWRRDRSVIDMSANAPAGLAYPEGFPLAETVVRERDGYLEAVHVVPSNRSLLVGFPLEAFEASMWAFGLKLSAVSGILMFFGIGVGWRLLDRETSKIAEMADAAGRIAHGNPSERILASNAGTELVELAEVLNETFGRLERSFEQQARFTADASHELRTPLTAILTRCQLTLSKDREPEKYREALSDTLDAAQQMRKIVESLLELTRMDSGESLLDLTKRDLAGVVVDTVKLLEPLRESRNIEIETAMERFEILIDFSKIQQVCINVLANALKFSPPGSKVNISVSKTGHEARLVIADEGCGIPEKDLPYLFDRFYQTNDSHRRSEKGTGLGLAIAKAIVVAHGGSIQASNRVSGGAVFRVTLPCDPRKAGS